MPEIAKGQVLVEGVPVFQFGKSRSRSIDEHIRGLNAKLAATKAVLVERERELLEIKGPCSTCPLHHAHSGPCAPARKA